MKPRHFWWLLEDEKTARDPKKLGKSDVRRLHRMMARRQAELDKARNDGITSA